MACFIKYLIHAENGEKPCGDNEYEDGDSINENITDVQKLIDCCIYREGLFRTIYSSKSKEFRPFIKNIYSDNFEDVETFVTYYTSKVYKIFPVNTIPTENLESGVGTRSVSIESGVGNRSGNVEQGKSVLEAQDEKVIKNFIRKFYHYKYDDIRGIIVDNNFNCIIVALNDKFCGNVDREHKSNYQYILFNSSGSRQKCHDPDCNKYKTNDIPIESFSQDIKSIILGHLNINDGELELILKTTKECSEYIVENFDDKITNIEFDKNLMLFKGDASENTVIELKGKCKKCLCEHQISSDGYCIKCKICSSVFPKQQCIPIFEQKFQTINLFWQLIQHNTIIINNNYSNIEDDLFFNCDINIDKSVLKNKKCTHLVNLILDGHKVSKISLLLKAQNDNIVYDGEYFFFRNNIWKCDNQNLYITEIILNLEKLFQKIQTFYSTKETNDENNKLIKNIKCLVTKLNSYKFKEEIVKESRRYFFEENFKFKLNSKHFLVPFKNGLWDLYANVFRPATRNDYINLTCNYDYSNTVNNPKVYEFLNSVLPIKSVREYVLKEFAKCLNGDIPNTKFLIFIGDGANGKSQLLNLMKLTIGEFGEKVESTLLTRKRNNPNETSSEKLKLMGKRFAFLSEPEDGEKFNIGLLKELTGSEEIVARGLFSSPVSFIMHVKFFLACNELPQVKGEDTAIWRRIRVIDFPSKFVLDPQEDNEFKLDTRLPIIMREDITWRQTFMNILLDYYYKDIQEPIEVQIKTNEYRDENNEVFAWCEENLEYQENSILKLSDVCKKYFENKPVIDTKIKGRFRKTFEEYLKTLKKTYPLVQHECKSSSYKGMTYQGWKHFALKSNVSSINFQDD